MEHGPHQPKGGEQHEPEAAPIYEALSDEQRIQRGIADALNEERVIDDATARRIASQLHGGQASALYGLASSGALPDGLEREVAESVQDLPPELDGWIDPLLDYADARGEDRGPREGWAALTNDPEDAIEEARAAASRERRADRERFERYVELGLDPGDAEAVIEYEALSPEQRAAWAGRGPSEPREVDESPGADTESVLAADTTAQPEPRPHRIGLESPTERDMDLDDAEALLEFQNRRRQQRAEQTDAADELPIPERDTSPRPSPRIYVACLAAYNNSKLHGVWLDAARDIDELWADVQAMLASSPEPGAEEFAIHDFEDFTGYELGEHERLAFVSTLAKGIAEHGQAFAAYADWNRHGDPELARFGDHIEGVYPTREAWAEEVADEIFEWPRYRDAIPEPLQSNVTLNLTNLALELEQHRHVVEGDEGVYVFNPDA